MPKDHTADNLPVAMTDILAAWKLNPIQQVFSCMCNQLTPSEQIFSSSGHIVNSLRANLNPEKVEMLVSFNNNL